MVFERFTDRARRVTVLAQEEARLLGHNYLGTEHILLGLLHEGEGVAAKALESLKIDLYQVRREVEELMGTRGGAAPSGHIPFTPRAKKVLELSLREALQLGHNYIGTEHVLLGLIREGSGVAAQVLVKLGAELDSVRRAVIQILAGRPLHDATVDELAARPRYGLTGPPVEKGPDPFLQVLKEHMRVSLEERVEQGVTKSFVKCWCDLEFEGGDAHRIHVAEKLREVL